MGKIYPWLTLVPRVSLEERLGLDLAGLIVMGGMSGASITAQGLGKDPGYIAWTLEGAKNDNF